MPKLMGIVGNSSEKWKEGLLQYFKIKQFLIKNCDIFGLIRCVNKYCISLNYTILIEPRMRTSCFITRYRPWSPGGLQITFCSHIQCSRRSPYTKSCERKKNALIVIKQKESFKSDIIARLKSYFISLLSPSRLLFGFAWQHESACGCVREFAEKGECCVTRPCNGGEGGQLLCLLDMLSLSGWRLVELLPDSISLGGDYFLGSSWTFPYVENETRRDLFFLHFSRPITFLGKFSSCDHFEWIVSVFFQVQYRTYSIKTCKEGLKERLWIFSLKIFRALTLRDARTERFDTFSLAISQKTLTFKKLGLRHDQNQIRARENFSSIDWRNV